MVLLSIGGFSQTEAPQETLGRSTPRGSVVGFLRASEAGNYDRAAEYLDLRGSRAQGSELARQLQLLLDRYLQGNLTGLSRAPEGNLQDGLSPVLELVGSFRTTSGTLEIELERVEHGSQSYVWLFSRQTVARIPGAFRELDAAGSLRILPRALTEHRFLSVPLWKWLATIAGLVVALLSASLLTRGVTRILQPLIRRFIGTGQGPEATTFQGPIRLFLLAATLRIFAEASPSLLSRERWAGVGGGLAIIAIGWFLTQFVDILADLRARQLSRVKQPGEIAMLTLGRRLFKIAVSLVVALILLHGVGVNISAMLAGLGVGGIALALAAQKTLENLFGGISLIMREAIRVGDFCSVGGQAGVVEDIGLGSTRLRTLDRTLVSLPNAQISQLNVENMTLRDKFWFHQVLGLRYDSSAGQMRSILEGIEKLLQNAARVEHSTARVRLIGFGATSQTLEVFAYVLEQNQEDFLRAQQELLLKILDVVDAAGTCIASPVVINETAPRNGSESKRD